MLKLKTQWGTEVDVKIRVSKYTLNDNLYVGLDYYEDGLYEGPWSDLTVNLSNKLPLDRAYIDTNNNGESIVEWLTSLGLGEVIGYVCSGFCKYPLFQFNVVKLMALVEQVA